jgi:hypothetical protein
METAMGHNRHIQDRNGHEIINCAEPAKTQAKSTNVTADVTPHVTANVTANVTGLAEPVEASHTEKAVDFDCDMVSHFGSELQSGVSDAADLEQGLHGGVSAAPTAPSARERASAANMHHAGHHADIDAPLSEQTNRDTLVEHVDHLAQRRRSRKGESRKRLSQGDLLRNLPPNLTRDRDAYVFQRRVPKSVFRSTAESAFTNKHSSRILRIRLGPMTPPEAKKRARHLNAFFDILVASMSVPMSSCMNIPMNKNTVSSEQPDPFDVLALELRRLRDAFAGEAPPIDTATAIYATHIRDIVHAERARTGGESDDIVARHASQITANAFSRMQTFSTLMDQLKGDPSFLDQLGAVIGDRSPQPTGVRGAPGEDSSGHTHQSTKLMTYRGYDGAEHAHDPIRSVNQGGGEAANVSATVKRPVDATTPAQEPHDNGASQTLVPDAHPNSARGMPPAEAGAGPQAGPADAPAGMNTESRASLEIAPQEVVPGTADAGTKPADHTITASVMNAAYATQYAFGGFGLSVAPATTGAWQSPSPGPVHSAPAHQMSPHHLPSQRDAVYHGPTHHGPGHQFPPYQAHPYHQPGPAPTFSELADSYD